MDEELTLRTLARREAERKLGMLPSELLESAWVREAQVEAVIDAVLGVTYADYPKALAHVRHVGEWSARVAAVLPYGPEPGFARRVGVLSEVEPDALQHVPELELYAEPVRQYQALTCAEVHEPAAAALIVAVADEFDRRISPFEQRRAPSPSSVLAAMLANADHVCRPIVEALVVASRRGTARLTMSHRR